jgi:hypothetical protein
LQAFRYFKHLRDKHYVHDENAYAQCIPCAALNSGNKSYKIEKIFTLAMVETIEQANYSNLHLLISQAQDWLNLELDQLFNELTGELEAQPYELLCSISEVKYTAPGLDAISKRREVP